MVRRMVAGSALAIGAVSWIGSEPASAGSVTTTISGVGITVWVAGIEEVTFSCDQETSVLAVSGVIPSPTLPCSYVEDVIVGADAAVRRIDGTGLDAPEFSADPILSTSAASSENVVIGTERADHLSGQLVVVRGDSVVDASINADTVRVLGTASDDALTLIQTAGFPPSTPALVPGVRWSAGGEAVVRHLFTEKVELWGLEGDDTLTTSGPNPDISAFRADGGPGDDALDANGEPGTLDGGTGTNTLTGSTGPDTLVSRSTSDTIDGRGGGDVLVDATSPRSFGRTVVSPVTSGYQLEPEGDLGVVRVRPAATSGRTTRVTSSLNRPGQIELTAGTGAIRMVQRGLDGAYDSTLFDVVLHPGTTVDATGRAGGQDLYDLTIPSGSWTRHDEAGRTIVEPDGQGLPTPITLHAMDEVSVHGPWTDLDEGFVHRVVRDLLFTFIDTAGRQEQAAAIEAGTSTRAGFVDQILGDRAYRGLDVERTFLEHLGRGADPSGKAYWVASLGNGKALWRFRAQLLGSNEYFAKAGGTNASWLAAAYSDVLGRNPDPSGQAYWTRKLDGGAERGMVALQFINAPETRRRVVDDQYLRFLDRLPTSDEQRDGAALLLTAFGEQRLIRSLAVGTEYYERS